MVRRTIWLISRIIIRIIRTKLQRLTIISLPPMVAAELQEAAWPEIKVYLSPPGQARGANKIIPPPMFVVLLLRSRTPKITCSGNEQMRHNR